MPPRKQVYGKRPRKAPTFASSSLFTWSSSSSPDRPKDTDATTDENDVQKITQRLQTTKISGPPKRHPDSQRTKREPLEKVDANARAVVELRSGSTAQESATAKKPKGDDIHHESREIQAPSPDLPAEPVPQKTVARRTARTVKSKPRPDAEASSLNEPEKPIRSTRRQTSRAENRCQVVEEDSNVYADYARPLLSLCSDASAKNSPTSFSNWTESLEKYFHISKIAEASYGEVYRLSLQAPRPGFSRADESVLKIIALKPPPNAPSGSQRKAKAQISQMSSVASVVSEVQSLQRMTSTPGFTNFREIRVLQGRPCGAFVAAWKAFNNTQKKGEKSYFPDPSRKTSYDEYQLWAVIEMQDAGVDLEHFQTDNIWTCWDVFWGVALSLGKGEEEAEFEHRDLHLGNICCRSTRLLPEPNDEGFSESGTLPSLSQPKIENIHRTVGFTGLETTIIDYTLSRAVMSTSASEAGLDSDGTSKEPSEKTEAEVAYLDLESEEGLFEGDADEDYQYEIYRIMRTSVLSHSTLATKTQNRGRKPSSKVPPLMWRSFHPRTNLIWLHFILRTLLSTAVEEHSSTRSSGADSSSIRSRTPSLQSEDQPGVTARAMELETALRQVDLLLDPIELAGPYGLESVRDLIAVAVTEGWLSEPDVLELGS